MKRILPVFLTAALSLGLTACSGERDRLSLKETEAAFNESDNTNSVEQNESNILIAYVPAKDSTAVEETAVILRDALGGSLEEISQDTAVDTIAYEFILLGFEAQNSTLPQALQAFLENSDFGARTIYPFVLGENNDPAAVFSAISQLQPGALLGDSALLFSENTQEQEMIDWAEGLGLSDNTLLPETADGNTAATAQVTPQKQQVLYLWEEGNAPAVTEYTVNDRGYFDDPDFRPYITSFPVPQGTDIKGAVLICPGGAFQFRSVQPEGIDVAEALSALGYQCFVVDYRLRPYTQQEGALDLARAVRFVRAHAQEYGIDENDIAVMGFSAGGILSGEMLLNFDGQVTGAALDPDYVPDWLDEVSADAAACGMIYSFYGRLSLGTTDVELLRSGNLPPTFYCYGTRDPFYSQFLANAEAVRQADVSVTELELENMPHGFGADGGWISAYDDWLTEIFSDSNTGKE